MTGIQLTLATELHCIRTALHTQCSYDGNSVDAGHCTAYAVQLWLFCEWLAGQFYGVAKMPFVFSHVEYCDMHFVYGFCDGNARADVQE